MAITIDPITRLEGHFSAYLDVTGPSGSVTSAYCSSHLYRGFENILKGRRPNDAVTLTQRI
jgi:Ni,Fe-hydrogenase I large subunit